MTRSSDIEHRVGELLRQVSRTIILPRFLNLTADDVREKTPGELVTVVDRAAEAALAEGLTAILPDARVIGEEGCADRPEQLDDLHEGLAWLVDPLDGTANFAAGKGPFGLIVALVRNGQTLAGWLYDPLRDRLFHAARGKGAFVDGRALRVRPRRQGRAVATLATQFLRPAIREAVTRDGERSFLLHPIPRCAATHYPSLCAGEVDIALFQRTLPWDHAAGALLLLEAGGHVARWDGSPYLFADGRSGLLVAASEALWHEAAAALLRDDMLLAAGDQLVPQQTEVMVRPALTT